MNWLKKMDTVLLCMYGHSDQNPTFVMYQDWLKDQPIDKGELEDILLYLHREHMIYCERGGDRTHPWVEGADVKYLISCKGKLFWEGVGGFSEKDKRDSKAATLQSWQTWAIVAGTVLAGLYALQEILKYISHLFSSSCH